MIPGIVAASGSGASGGGSSYPDALAVADFLLGEYFVNGNQVTAADIIDRPDLIDANGLNLDWDVAGAFATVLGDFLAALALPELTIVTETTEDGSGNMDVVNVFSTTTTSVLQIFTNGSMGNASEDTVPGLGGGRFAQASAPARPALRRIAITRTAGTLSISVNGGAVVADATPNTAATYNAARLGASESDTFPTLNGHIRRIIIYPVQSDAALPALSTP